jgi:hypothetical protein
LESGELTGVHARIIMPDLRQYGETTAVMIADKEIDNTQGSRQLSNLKLEGQDFSPLLDPAAGNIRKGLEDTHIPHGIAVRARFTPSCELSARFLVVQKRLVQLQEASNAA